ncbi:MAG: permease-like cell division protein FtsX [Desulfosalsimonadaceae bacterium]
MRKTPVLLMLGQNVRRALRDIRNNLSLYGICAVTIALAVFIVSAFTLFYINATEFLDVWKQGVRVMAYVDGQLPQKRLDAIESRIKAMDTVGGVVFVPREKAFAQLHADIGEQSGLLEGLETNPLPDAFEIRLRGSTSDLEAIGRLAASVAAIEGVDDVEYAQKWLSQFSGVYNLFTVTGLALVIMFVVAIAFIVANTLRLILYSRREEIEIMWIVGADEAFIKSPFYLESLLLGLAGGTAGLLLLGLTYMGTVPRFGPEILFSSYEICFLPASICGLIIFSSTVVGWAGCHFSLKRFLRI